jgi:hypothetical protein
MHGLQHVEMYRKRKRTKNDTSVDTEKIKEQRTGG